MPQHLPTAGNLTFQLRNCINLNSTLSVKVRQFPPHNALILDAGRPLIISTITVHFLQMEVLVQCIVV